MKTYRGDYDGNGQDDPLRARRKEIWKKQVRRKKMMALLVLIGIFAAIIIAVGLAIFGLVRLIKSGAEEKKSPDLPISGANLVLVDNEEIEDDKVFLSGPIITPTLNQTGEEVPDDTVTVTNTGNNQLIIVDAGHGGYDGGTNGAGVLEKDINLSIAYMVKEELELRGYRVYMTRTDDTFVGLNERAKLTNNQDGAVAMVSIHQNAIPEYPDIQGVEAWTFDRAGCRELAAALTEHVSEATGANKRGVYYRTNLVVTSKTNIPSVIVECGYLTNEEEASKLAGEDYQKKVTLGICNAVDDFTATYYN